MKRNMRNIISETIEKFKVEKVRVREESDKTFDETINRLKKAIKLMDKYKGKKNFTDKELKEIQNLLCFKNLGYCCGLSKPCYFRDTVLYILEISKKQFREKENWVKSTIK